MGENLWDHITPAMLLSGYTREPWDLDEFIASFAPADEGRVIRPRRKLSRTDKGLLTVCAACVLTVIGCVFYR
jgi:hypothetical protein